MSDDVFWNAVAERDMRFDGILYYGVVTTGVYCRPGCPSRRPRRDNVRFFVTPREAELAGLRPCKRCRPDSAEQPVGVAAQVLAACRVAMTECDATLASVCGALKLSDRTLRRSFNEILGISPTEFLAAARVERLKQSLRRHDRVTDAGYAAGFGSSSRLYERSVEKLGMTPGAYAHGGAGQRVRFAVAETALGWLAVAATDRGLCFARFGTSARALEQELRQTFPQARLDAAEGDAWIRALFEIADAPASWRALPVDIHGTTFQAKVWRALKEIPPGEQRTYAQVAAAIGSPKSTRAVANACAANPVALAVPCHRVVPKSGGTGGYRWGADRKRRLLAAEIGEIGDS